MLLSLQYLHINDFECIPHEGKCHVESLSNLIKVLGEHGYHAIECFKVPDDSEEQLVRYSIGQGDNYENEQSREVC